MKKDKLHHITTFQVKGGGVYNLDDRLSAFANLGYVQKPPILDNVIDYDGNVPLILIMRSSHQQRLVVLTEVVMLPLKVVTTTHNGKIET